MPTARPFNKYVISLKVRGITLRENYDGLFRHAKRRARKCLKKMNADQVLVHEIDHRRANKEGEELWRYPKQSPLSITITHNPPPGAEAHPLPCLYPAFMCSCDIDDGLRGSIYIGSEELK